MSHFLTVDLMHEVCFAIVQEHMAAFEHIPPFETCDLSKLEAALGAPQRTFDGKQLYPTLESQAAVLFYEIIKQHAFDNGNKRMAVVSLFVFLALNKRWVRTNPWELYHIAVEVAKSDTKRHSAVLKKLEAFIQRHMERK